MQSRKKKREKGKLRILLTGGHAATSAISVMEEIIRRKDVSPFNEIYWIGAKRAFEGKNVPTLESISIPKLNVRHYQISAGKLRKRFDFWSIVSFLKIPLGFLQAFIIVSRVNPDLVLSFGGYVALPVVISSKLRGIPVVIHEQTVVSGRANLVCSYFCDLVLISREESRSFFSRKKVVLVGNPTTTQMAEITPKTSIGTPPTIYVTGGSRGSQIVNNLVENSLEYLLKRFNIIHHTGFVDYRKFLGIRENLPRKLKQAYEVYPMIDPMKRDNVFRLADIVVARAGAHTVSDIIVSKRPAVLIPIPWTNFNEQLKNAQYAQKFGIAQILEEKDATNKNFIDKIEYTLKNWQKIVDRVKNKKSIDVDASRKIVDLLEEVVDEN
jgi:UDP-N-acetylglucosamine--N-acetylmuramyl-(pentapeptide) pyrophosphoryl-undecaprenol N-acetylglucosamine transferase